MRLDLFRLTKTTACEYAYSLGETQTQSHHYTKIFEFRML